MNFFITGTDTGVGKSVISGLLARYLLNQGNTVITQKWIETGAEAGSSDIDTHLRFMGMDRAEIKDILDLVLPYSFKLACSPHLAAEAEDVAIDKDKIKKAFKSLLDKFDSVIAEGSGGVLVPISRDSLIIDILKELAIPVIIVAANKLGVINHTLLTIEALRVRDINIEGVIFNDQPDYNNKQVCDDNLRIIKELTSIKILGRLFWSDDATYLHEEFKSIGKNLIL